LVEAVLKKGSWKEYQPILKKMDQYCEFPNQYIKNPPKSDHRAKPIIIVYMIGGVTYSEIAAFRWLGEKYGKNKIQLIISILYREINNYLYYIDN